MPLTASSRPYRAVIDESTSGEKTVVSAVADKHIDILNVVIDLASGQDKTTLAEVKRDNDGTLDLTGRTSEIHFSCANAECERELIDKSNIYCSLECERKAIDEA